MLVNRALFHLHHCSAAFSETNCDKSIAVLPEQANSFSAPICRDYSGMLHHALFILAAAWVLGHSIMKFPFVWLAVGEASTPFINLRYSPLTAVSTALQDQPVICL